MKIYCSGAARIRHKTTREIYEIESDELYWDAVGGDERSMGAESQYQAVFEHPQLGELTWELWEYPIGAENYRDTSVGDHELIADLNYGLEHERPDPDEWLEYDLPAEPLKIFMDSYHQTGNLLAEIGRDDGRYIVNRLVFSHQVTALEAYLGDTLIKAVASDVQAMERLIAEDTELSKQKFTLAQISKEPGLVQSKVREHLRTILYHNLAKVDVLYNIVFGIRILGLTEKKADLIKAVKLRASQWFRQGRKRAFHIHSNVCSRDGGYDQDSRRTRRKGYSRAASRVISGFRPAFQRATQEIPAEFRGYNT